MARIALLLACLGALGCTSQAPPSGEPTAASEASAAVKTEPASSEPQESSTAPIVALPADVAANSSPEKSKAEQPAKTEKPERMPVLVSPFYDSTGPKINVGEFNGELSAATPESITELTKTMKESWATLSPETMYVTAIRLYDFGKKDEAVYWFYCAQFRARLFQSLLHKQSPGRIGAEGFERTQAHGAFYTLAGEYINGYAFGDLEKLQATITRVKSDNEQVPELKKIYPRLVFADEEEWPEHNQEIAAGLDKFVEHIKSNADVIKAKRKEKGTDEKY